MKTPKSSIHEFLGQNFPPEKWKKQLRDCLPPDGKVTTDMPLVRVLDAKVAGDERCREVIVLKANEVCTDRNVREINAFPPDGMWSKWGDLAVPIIKCMLIKRMAEILVEQKLSEVPADWHIEFCYVHGSGA